MDEVLDLAGETEKVLTLKLPQEMSQEDGAQVREILNRENQSLREAVSASLAEGINQKETREQLAGRVRAGLGAAVGGLAGHRAVMRRVQVPSAWSRPRLIRVRRFTAAARL